MRYIVGLTGGIGSGKSTVADAFAQLGVTIVDADIIARQVVEPGQPALAKIAAHFGPTILAQDGTLNRRRLRETIFAAPEKKAWLDGLLHPLIAEKTAQLIAQATSSYVLWVVPLLVENQLQHKASRILVIDVSPETQIDRTITRDKVTQDQATQILAAQASREARLVCADDVINNDGTPEQILPEVARLHKQYLALAAQPVLQEKE